ncbi:MAG: GAF domain-containing protein [Armatimonadetes bacterium]|nr:GAF domain-containing protein [Armatimonadota bacterium]
MAEALEKTTDMVRRLCQMEQELATSTDFDQVLARIATFSQEITSADEASILLYDEEKDELYFKKTEGDMGEIIQKVRIPLDQPSIAGYALKNREAQIINDVPNDPRHFKAVDRVARYTTHSLLAVPIVWGERVFGVIEAINKQEGASFTEDDRELLSVLASHAAVVINNVHLMEELQNFFVHTLEILVAALETIEPQSEGHIIRVTRLAAGVARRLGIEGKDYDTIWYAAYFHDIGKLLLEPGEAAVDEKRHPVVGANMMSKIKILEKTAPLVRHHHERFNGTGFPDRLKGQEMSVGARILALAEDYEEQWMARRRVQSREKFREEFFASIGYAHDPELVPLFREVSENIL